MSEHPPAPEQRTIDVDVNDLDTRGKTLLGYAAVYGAESRDLGGFTETIRPGAFAGVLPDADVRCLLNHDPSQVLGRSRSGTLRLADEERGLRFECDLPESPLGDNVRESVRRGDIDGASFRFIVGDETWDGDKRTIVAVKELHDVTVATYGAYDAASVELRTRPTPETPAPSQEDTVKTEDRSEGGLAVEDRTAEVPNIATRVNEAFFSIPKGESRSLTTTSAASIAPPELATYVYDRLRPRSVLLASGVQVVRTDRDSIQWPRLTADATVATYNEGAAITPSDPTFATLTATPRKFAALIQFSNEVIDDSVPSIVDTMNAHVSKLLALKLDVQAFEGNGTAPNIRGLSNIPGIQTVATAANGAPITLDNIANAISLLEQANATAGAIAMHPYVWNTLRTMKTSTGEYLLNDEPTGPGDATRLSMWGVPVSLTPQLSRTETQGTSNVASSVYVYDPSQVVVVLRNDATIELDRSRLFNQDMSELRGKLRADLVSPNPTAIVRITGAI